MINRANSAHGDNGTYKPDRKGKGKLVEYEINDIILNMGHDYGRIGTEHEYSETRNDFARQLICTTCARKEETKGAVKRHLAGVHREMGKVKDLNCPYTDGTFKHLGSLNRHIYINKKL